MTAEWGESFTGERESAHRHRHLWDYFRSTRAHVDRMWRAFGVLAKGGPAVDEPAGLPGMPRFWDKDDAMALPAGLISDQVRAAYAEILAGDDAAREGEPEAVRETTLSDLDREAMADGITAKEQWERNATAGSTWEEQGRPSWPFVRDGGPSVSSVREAEPIDYALTPEGEAEAQRFERDEADQAELGRRTDALYSKTPYEAGFAWDPADTWADVDERERLADAGTDEERGDNQPEEPEDYPGDYPGKFAAEHPWPDWGHGAAGEFSTFDDVMRDPPELTEPEAGQ